MMIALFCLILLSISYLSFAQLHHDQSINPSTKQSEMNQALNESINQSIKQSIDQVVSPSSGKPPVLTGLSGCTYQSIDQTINCPRPVELTLTGSGFMTGLEHMIYPNTYLKVALMVPSTTRLYQCVMDSRTAIYLNDTMIRCQIVDNGYGKIPTGIMMNIMLTNSETGNMTMLTSAVSFAIEAAPRIDRVSGCSVVSADGRTVSQCDVLVDRITLHGSGFMSVDRSYSKFTFGSSSRLLYMYQSNDLIVRYTADEIVLDFSTSSLFLPAIDAQNGQAVPLILGDSINSQIWSTEAVYVAFNSLPPPTIQSFAFSNGQKCVLDNSTGTSRYRDCVAGFSIFTISGHNFFADLTVYVGGQPCVIKSRTNSYLAVNLPIYAFTAGHFYDLTVTTLSGSATLSSVIAFNTDPIITRVVPCIDLGGGVDTLDSIFCRPTETFTLKVLNFNRTDLPRVWFVNTQFDTTVECPQVQMADKETITCVTPQIPSVIWYRSSVKVFMEWDDGTKTNTLFVYNVWDVVDAPRVTSVSGCFSDSNDPLYVNQCLGQPNDAIILTIHGIRLNNAPENPWTVILNRVDRCYQPYIVDNNTITCLLPMVDEMIDARDLTFDVKYPIRLSGQVSRRTTGSNAAYVTYVRQENHPSSSSSSTSTSTIAVAVVFSVIGAALLGVCLVLLWRKIYTKESIRLFERPRQGDSDFADESSTTVRHVELTGVE